MKPVILYVEDEARSRKVMDMLLSHRMGLSVTMFEDSANFLSRAEALSPRPDVIFLDIHVRPHSGFEMLSMLRQSGHFDGVPIVALTASIMNEEVNELQVAGFDGCLGKPIDTDTFADILERIVAGEKIWHIVN